jgi:hypothetical protein
MPTFEAMVTEVDRRNRYSIYTVLSQFVHGSHYGGSVYRQGLGGSKRFEERVRISEWAMLLRVLWWSLFNSASDIERVCAKRELRSVPSSTIDGIASALEGLSSRELPLQPPRS